ncbi:MAG: HIT family protein [Bacteroidales bacterium]|nr:HIT family protein [Bacteroidales bacterium]
METLFSKIVKGDIPCYKIAENESCFAFLDIAPLAKGHVLVIPKQPVDYIFDMEDNDFSELMLFAKKIAAAIKKAFPCPKVGMAVIGLDVPHAHVHLVPLQQVKDLDFSRERLQLSPADFAEIAKSIAQNLV